MGNRSQHWNLSQFNKSSIGLRLYRPISRADRELSVRLPGKPLIGVARWTGGDGDEDDSCPSLRRMWSCFCIFLFAAFLAASFRRASDLWSADMFRRCSLFRWASCCWRLSLWSGLRFFLHILFFSDCSLRRRETSLFPCADSGRLLLNGRLLREGTRVPEGCFGDVAVVMRVFSTAFIRLMMLIRSLLTMDEDAVLEVDGGGCGRYATYGIWLRLFDIEWWWQESYIFQWSSCDVGVDVFFVTFQWRQRTKQRPCT